MDLLQFIDTHCHLTFEPLSQQINEVLARSKQAGITGWITVGTDLDHSRQCIALAQQFDAIRATVGLHPHDAKDMTDDIMRQLRQLTLDKQVVAVGETGLDLHYHFSSPAEQKKAFHLQLELAVERNLPVVIHSREALEETLNILDEYKNRLERVVFHCFTGTADQASKILDRGFMISFTGALTFKNSHHIREAAKFVPINRVMLETDCPYMSPDPVRKIRPNEPGFLIYTAKNLATLKGIDLEQMAGIINENTAKFYKKHQ